MRKYKINVGKDVPRLLLNSCEGMISALKVYSCPVGVLARDYASNPESVAPALISDAQDHVDLSIGLIRIHVQDFHAYLANRITQSWRTQREIRSLEVNEATAYVLLHLDNIGLIKVPPSDDHLIRPVIRQLDHALLNGKPTVERIEP